MSEVTTTDSVDFLKKRIDDIIADSLSQHDEMCALKSALNCVSQTPVAWLVKIFSDSGLLLDTRL